MRKATAIFFLSLFLLSYTELGQLLKLPKVITHFIEHRKWEPQVGFLAYFQMHYFSDDNNAGDDAKDRQLPFKEHNGCQASSAISFSFSSIDVILQHNDAQSTVVYPQIKDALTVSAFTGSVFQPPRV